VNITIIGAGNAGWHLATGLADAGHRIVQVFSRQISRANLLANKTRSKPVTDFSLISSGSDLYILAVPDSVIQSTALQLASSIPADSIVVHCSGASPADLLVSAFRRSGVFWPPQTLSVNRPHRWSGAPICISSSDEGVLSILIDIAADLGASVHILTEAQRKALHLAAVFVNNFTNHCLTAGHDICREAGVDFSILHPIALQTIEGALAADPATLQTGPASRGDEVTLGTHQAYLHRHLPHWERLYQALSESILRFSKSGPSSTNL